MHRRYAALAVLAAAALVRPAAAAGPCSVAIDVTKDVVIADQAATSGLVDDDAIDLTGLSAATSGDDLVLVVQTVGFTHPHPWAGTGAQPVPGEWSVSFSVGGTAWQAGASGAEYLGIQSSTGPYAFWATSGATNHEVTGSYGSDGTVTVRVPLALLGATAGTEVSGFGGHAEERFVSWGEWHEKKFALTASDDMQSVQTYVVGDSC